MNSRNCSWPGNDELMLLYHDKEWGVPLHNDKKLFEFFVLDAFQAGLNWKIILHKRENFRKAFSNYDIKKIANYKNKDYLRLMEDVGIIRNRLKIQATITNAQKFLEVKKEFGTFNKYIWKFTNHNTIRNKWESQSDLPVKSAESDAMSIDLKKRGFKFVGSTICYAFMQASGMVNDHLVTCERYKSI